MNWLSILSGAAGLGSLGSSLGLFGGEDQPGDMPAFDTDASIARIMGFYEQAETGLQAGVEAGFGGMAQQTAGNLAARGIYSSPVSEYAFAQDRQVQMNALAQAQQNFQMQKAGALTGAAQSGDAYNQRIAQANQQMQQNNYNQSLRSQQALGGALGGLSGALLPYAMAPQGGQQDDQQNQQQWRAPMRRQQGQQYNPYNIYGGGQS